MSNQRFRTIDYGPLKEKFTNTSCFVDHIDLPEIRRSYVADIYLRQEKAPQYYHTTERKEIVKFTVTYIPEDNSEGKGLIPYAKQVVEDVLQTK